MTGQFDSADRPRYLEKSYRSIVSLIGESGERLCLGINGRREVLDCTYPCRSVSIGLRDRRPCVDLV